jgi:hypothetical protein
MAGRAGLPLALYRSAVKNLTGDTAIVRPGGVQAAIVSGEVHMRKLVVSRDMRKEIEVTAGLHNELIAEDRSTQAHGSPSQTPAALHSACRTPPKVRTSATPTFRVGGKIFATLAYEKEGYGALLLTPGQQEGWWPMLRKSSLRYPEVGANRVRNRSISEASRSGNYLTPACRLLDSSVIFHRSARPK